MTVIDIDEGKAWYAPKITQFTMAIAQPTNSESVVKALHHSGLQPTVSSQQLWLEDVARFKPAEMRAGIVRWRRAAANTGVHAGVLLHDCRGCDEDL